MEEIEKYLNMYENQIELNHRYASFDFCYNYFSSYKGNLVGENLQTSCMQLWSYLASWGMLRGSSQLLQCSPASLKPIIQYINDNPDYEIDLTDSEYSQKVLDLYTAIDSIIEDIFIERLKNDKSQDVQKERKTLVTKIILGVYACCPAFDVNFCKTFHISTTGPLTDKNIKAIVDFYDKHQSFFINYKKRQTLCFDESNNFSCPYSIAKLIDMYGFMAGLKKDK